MQLKLVLASLFLAASVFAAPQDESTHVKPHPPAPEEVVENWGEDVTKREADGAAIFARACSYKTGCRSEPNVKAGRYCGYCWEVAGNKPWVGTHMYQLNGKSGSDGCCSYGYNRDCAREYNGQTYSRKYCFV